MAMPSGSSRCSPAQYMRKGLMLQGPTICTRTQKGTMHNPAAFLSPLSKRSAADLIKFTNAGVTLTLAPETVAKQSSRLQVQDSATTAGAKSYANLLGNGTDLDINFSEGTLLKDIVLHKSPAGVGTDTPYTASFLLTADSDIDLVAGTTSLSSAGTFTTSDEVQILSNGKVVAYIWPPRAEASAAAGPEDSHIPIEVAYKATKRGILITKIVPGNWLAAAIYPVRADLTLSQYSGSGDGTVQTGPYPDVWGDQRVATNGRESSYTSQYAEVLSSAYYSATGWQHINRGFFPFDTSALPDNALVSGATLHLYPSSVYDDFNDAYSYLNVYQGTQSSMSSLSTYDIDNCGDGHDGSNKGFGRSRYYRHVSGYVYLDTLE